jgi:hypothetical protein
MSAKIGEPGGAPRARWRPARWLVVTIVAAVATISCAGPAGPALTTADPGTPVSTPVATPPGVSPGTGPSSAPTPTAAPPPVAVLVTPDATITGSLGTYVIDGRGSDAGWPPFDTLPTFLAGPHELLEIRLADGVEIGPQTQVLFAPAEDLAGADSRAAPGATVGPDATRLLVGPLPSGRWVLAARVFRADGRGDGMTFWALTVG